jgi:amino acid transporter
MLLSGTLFALFMAGFWLYCLTDAILAPAAECKGLPKPAWLAIIAVTFICGAIAWLVVRAWARGSSWTLRQPQPRSRDDGYLLSLRWTDQDDAVTHYPAGQVSMTGAQPVPRGPDDDEEFLRALDRAIHGTRQAGEEI